MDKTFLAGFGLVSFIVVVIDLILAFKAFNKKTKTGFFLAGTCFFAGMVSVSYTLSLLTKTYFMMSFLSSIYFCCIDVMLVCLVFFVWEFTRQKITTARIWERRLIIIYAIFDCAVLMLNPFYEIAITYIPRNLSITSYSYGMKILYEGHLLFSYILVVVVLIHLIRKMFHVPAAYQMQYFYAIIGVILVVAYNAIFLYWPKVSVYSFLDYSIWGYSLTAFFLYWNSFDYSTHGALKNFRTWIFENINQGIVMFDYEDNLILKNERADKLLFAIDLKEQMKLDDFQKQCGIDMELVKKENYAFQCYMKDDSHYIPLRCDYRPLWDDKQKMMASLFVFTDYAMETDLLTGFHSWDYFNRKMLEEQATYGYPAAVAICDINGLSDINNTLGRNKGDQAIMILSSLMKKHFPTNSYYVRGHEANLIAISYNSSEESMKSCLQEIQKEISIIKDFPYYLNMQSAVSIASEEDRDVLKAIRIAAKAMRAKKLLDRSSNHSELMNSLIHALKECDSDTEAHVQRTQEMGSKLGKRIGLSDAQQSDLSLLCLLHDIGKIGIPLEILNKPGKLTPTEWEIIKSHVEKGYQIASSSQELSGIADMILHHHERWDGNGYPDGLSKETIPLLSRVICVVDAYDAMVNNRSYRQALTRAEAKEELVRCAGTQFDPGIVSELLYLLKEEEDENQIADGSAESPNPIDRTGRIQEDLPEQSEEGSIHEIRYSRYILGEKGNILSVDDEFERLTGYSKEDVAEMKLTQSSLIPKEEVLEYTFRVNKSLGKSPMAYFEHRLRRKDGSQIYVFCYGKRFFDSAERAERSEIIIANSAETFSFQMLAANEQSKALNRLEHWEKKYRCDSLTGLLNHEAFKNDVEMKMLMGGVKVMMLMMDLDHFKEYNDTYGHRAGDEFLILVAQSLTYALRKDDLACRMGGDEFAAVLFYGEQVSDHIMFDRARQICNKINQRLSSAKTFSSISMGAAVLDENITTFNQLYEAADKALYQSKEAGRARMSVYNAD